MRAYECILQHTHVSAIQRIVGGAARELLIAAQRHRGSLQRLRALRGVQLSLPAQPGAPGRK